MTALDTVVPFLFVFSYRTNFGPFAYSFCFLTHTKIFELTMHSRGIAVRPAMGVGGQCPFSCPCTFCFYMLPRPKVRSYAHPPFRPISCASHSLPPSFNLLMSSIDDCRAKPIFKVFCVQLSSTIMELVISVWSGKRTNVG